MSDAAPSTADRVRDARDTRTPRRAPSRPPPRRGASVCASTEVCSGVAHSIHGCRWSKLSSTAAAIQCSSPGRAHVARTSRRDRSPRAPGRGRACPDCDRCSVRTGRDIGGRGFGESDARVCSTRRHRVVRHAHRAAPAHATARVLPRAPPRRVRRAGRRPRGRPRRRGLRPRPASPRTRTSAPTGHFDMHARLRDMDRDGIAAEVIFHGSQNFEPIPFLPQLLGNDAELHLRPRARDGGRPDLQRLAGRRLLGGAGPPRRPRAPPDVGSRRGDRRAPARSTTPACGA